ncbi:putative S-adenosyl-L-methionine-binding protein MTH_1797 [uncultured Desulfatiglans sp.]|uniref:Putative S-adenosyl-L-methionine-binding protein MTH_1797 n=1 Tax=Uncultured Desulfatiglans sp. TaxID=1748965 RepID=A0A653A1S4_UNCDX|nr:putative S-adenosyl-L-methionine-binding protein MTH_1797 [uncultured Desulfatiglans sp.]
MNHTPDAHWPDMHLHPVGFVRSDIKSPVLAPGDGDLELQEKKEAIRQHHEKVEGGVCELVIFRDFAELLEGVEDFSHVMVLYWPHLIDPSKRQLRKVHPMGRKDLPLRGIFSTCSPARPNPILVSVVPLLERDGNILRVKGLEAVDGSPIIDIKPFVEPSHGAKNPKVPEWMSRIHRDLGLETK